MPTSRQMEKNKQRHKVTKCRVQAGYSKESRWTEGSRAWACAHRRGGGAATGDEAGVRTGLILEHLPGSGGGAATTGCNEIKGHPSISKDNRTEAVQVPVGGELDQGRSAGELSASAPQAPWRGEVLS